MVVPAVVDTVTVEIGASDQLWLLTPATDTLPPVLFNPRHEPKVPIAPFVLKTA